MDLSLDDIIKQKRRSSNVRADKERGNNTRRGPEVLGRSIPSYNSELRSRQRGRSSAYKRGDVDQPWSHDMYDGDNGPSSYLDRQRKRVRSDVDYSISDRDVHQQWVHDMFNDDDDDDKLLSFSRKRPVTSKHSQETRLIISNLDFNVSDLDIKELFAAYPSVISTGINYNRTGQSLGTAFAIFGEKADALAAMKHYNGVSLDGLPLRLSVEGEVLQREPSFRTSVARRLERVPEAQSSVRAPFAERSDRISRGRGRGRTPTIKELDAELDAYISAVHK